MKKQSKRKARAVTRRAVEVLLLTDPQVDVGTRKEIMARLSGRTVGGCRREK